MKRLLATALLVALLAAGCGFDPAAVPIPGATVAGPTYPVTIQFANALNLPVGAKVIANGVLVGTLRTVAIVAPTADSPGRVDARIDVKTEVPLPSTTVAQIRQNTILGDTFIGLTTPPDGFGQLLPPGGTIALRYTKPALQVEDLLTGISTFVTGGVLQQVQDIIERTNAVMPETPDETARVFSVLGRDVNDVADHLDINDKFLRAMEADLAAVLDNTDAVTELLSDAGAVHITNEAKSLVNIIGIIGALGEITKALGWLAPLAQAGDAAAKAFVPLLFTSNPLDVRAPSNLNRLVDVIRTKVIPFAEHGPKLNITAIQADPVSEQDQIDGVVDALRMIGAVR